ncbi:MAG: phosphodiester glycosidase family protein [Spartobacteria bacterium]
MRTPLKRLLFYLALAALGSTGSVFAAEGGESAAPADWKVTAIERQPVVEGAVEYRRYSLDGKGSATGTKVQLALFSNKKATLRVFDQPDSNRSLAETMKERNALAGVNGGYFDPEGKPVGLLRSEGKTIAPFRRARLLSGVLAVGQGTVEIFRASEFPAKRDWREALQCGPFLLDRGKPVAGLNDTRSARRTFVLTTTDRRTAIGSCAPVTLAGLARVLAALPELKVARALNLDGGSSSAFWCRTSEETFSVTEMKTVRDFLAVVPRTDR